MTGINGTKASAERKVARRRGAQRAEGAASHQAKSRHGCNCLVHESSREGTTYAHGFQDA